MPKKKSGSSKKSKVDISDSEITNTSESIKCDTSSLIKEKKKKKKKIKSRRKKKSKDDYVIKKVCPIQLKKSLNYNVSNYNTKQNLTKDEYDIQFDKLRTQYIQLCQEFCKLQTELIKKDNEREVILVQIRELQKNNSDLIKNDLNLDEKKKSKTHKKNINLIDRYKKSCKNIIKDPLRDTDMETDDSDSEELSDTDTESDSAEESDLK